MAFLNLIDDSATVGDHIPGHTVDLTYHATLRLAQVPVRFKVCVLTTVDFDTGAVKLVDANGTTLITVLCNGPAGEHWYWANGYLPATLGKYYFQRGGNISGSLSVYSADVYELDWTTDPVEGALSATLGPVIVSADGGFRGTLNESIGTIAGTAIADGHGDLSESIGAIGVTADGTTTTPPAFQAAGTPVGHSSGTSTVAWPAHAAGDIALLVVTITNSSSTDPGAATLSTANGFAAVTGGSMLSSFGVVRTRQTLFWCRATSGAMSAPIVANAGGNPINAVIATYRGCTASGDPADVVGATSGNANNTAAAIGGATTTAANRLVVVTVGATSGSNSISGWTNADLASVTERVDNGPGSSFPLVAVADGVKLLAGAYGNTTATLASTSVWGGITVALKGT